MTLYLSNRDGDGKTNEEGHFRFPTNTFDGDILQTSSMAVTQNSPVGMSVLVSEGDFKISSGQGYSYAGWNSSDRTVMITTADPSNPRITTIVAYVDKTASTSPVPPNNPDIIKLAAVNGTPTATPTAPNDTTIQNEVGPGNPYIILADVRVNASALSISNANITDRRTFITLSNELYTNDVSMTTHYTRKVPSQEAVKKYVDFNYVANVEMTDFNDPAFLKPRKWEISASATMNSIANRPPGANAGFGETLSINLNGAIVGTPWTYATQLWRNYTGEHFVRTISTNGTGVITYGEWYQTFARHDNNWVTPTLANNWLNYSSSFANAGYMKDSTGYVHLRGLIKSGTVGSAAFTLPVGYRPSTNNIYVALSNNAIGRVTVYQTGEVTPQSPTSATWVSLEGIIFKAEQ